MIFYWDRFANRHEIFNWDTHSPALAGAPNPVPQAIMTKRGGVYHPSLSERQELYGQ